jgi:hypothetical protein
LKTEWEILPWQNKSEKAKVTALRLNSLGDPFFFAKVVMGYDRFVRHLHGQWLKSLSVADLHLVLEAPRDHFKSSCGTIVLPMWWALPFEDREEDWMRSFGYGDEWIRYMRRIHSANLRIVIASETEPNAILMGFRFDYQYQKNMMFREVFSDLLPKTGDNWNQLIKTHNRSSGQGEGTFNFVGVGTVLQSRHFDRAVEDDLFGEEALYSDSTRKSTIEWHRRLPGAFDTDILAPGFINLELVLGNRWGLNDLNGWIRENDPSFRFETHSAEGGCCDQHPAGVPIFPEEFTMERLAALRIRFGIRSYCTPGETPILMADWSEKQIIDVREGDMVMGYVKENRRWVMKPSKVLHKHDVGVRPIVQGMAADRIFRCTPDHKWLTGRGESDGHKVYMPPKVGRRMIDVYNPMSPIGQDQQRLYDWLGGIFDGEGTCVGSPTISQSSRNEEVCAEIERVLTELKIDFKFHEYAATRERWADKRSYVLNGGRSLKMKLLRHCHMVKKQRFVDSLWSESRRLSQRIATRRKQVKTESLIPAGNVPVYGLTTETGNYVAWGFASQNSAHYLNLPTSEEECSFRKSWLPRFRLFKKECGTSNDGTPIQKTVIERIPGKDGRVLEDIPVMNLEIILLLDPNHGGEKGRARHAANVVGILKEGKKKTIFLLESWAKSVSHDTMIGEVGNMASRWHVSKFYVEVIAGQDGWMHFFERDLRSRLPNTVVIALPKERGAGAKDRRILSMSPKYERGEFQVRATGGGSEEFMREYEFYPNGKTVDLIDGAGYLFNIVETEQIDTARWQDNVARDMERRRRAVGQAGY